MGLVQGVVRRLVSSVGTVIVGKDQEVELCVLALLCGGHVLIEDVPGVGKTMLAKAMARATGCNFERLQFTPDLLPGDVTGVSVFNMKTTEFEFRKGPIFAQVLLADEINRATPKTQSALLEAMEEGQVTVDGVTHPLPSPFIVLATQNPIELGGTFPLPEAQVDRFLVKVNLGYLALSDEVAMLDRFQRESPLDELAAVTDAAEIESCRHELQGVFCHHSLKEYCVRIVQRTRESTDVALGASPRGSLGLLHAAQARAAAKGRDYVTPDDIKELAHRVLGHRIVLRANAELRGITSAQVIDDVLASEVVPAERQLMAGEGS
ncbi:MAG: MoxR family ATPase [Candidatus Dormibacteraeota bacterium]|uniref:AAA family ATPase n=1 Tax=Candidatus Aeolococcus gillhamiae TaxID=3127015 RepID=A0A2W5ZG63_9BACT|nr:MoxR family ATPase [Candidatus Dormibacteraeota bacterium]PZR81995.1 MAG: AAA family ATPase [Candidatus Dormibacter sp. RRmetagenome_bin12]